MWSKDLFLVTSSAISTLLILLGKINDGGGLKLNIRPPTEEERRKFEKKGEQK